MSDLQARIGSKYAEEIFPNLSWVSPGYPARNGPLGNGQRSIEHGNDNVNHVGESPPENARSGRRVSLLTRMDMHDDSKTLLERMSMSVSPKGEPGVSLFERVEPIAPDDEERNAKSLDNLEFTLRNTPAVSSSSISSRDKGTPFHRKTPTIDTNSGIETQQTHRRSNGIVEETQNGDVSRNQVTQLRRQSTDSHSTPQNQDIAASRSNNPQSDKPHPIGTPLLSSTAFPNPSAEEVQVIDKGRGRKTPSEGKIWVGRLPPAKVRDLILPLVVQNAANRFSDTERRPSLQSPVVDTNVLSDKLLTLFAEKATEETSRDLRDRGQLLPKLVSTAEADNVPISLDASRLPSKLVQSNGVPQVESDRRLSSSSRSPLNVVQASEISQTRAPTEDMVAQPMTLAPAYDTYRKDKGIPLRYTPEPEFSEPQTTQHHQMSHLDLAPQHVPVAQPSSATPKDPSESQMPDSGSTLVTNNSLDPAPQHVPEAQPSSAASEDPSESQMPDGGSTSVTNNSSYLATSHRPPVTPPRKHCESQWGCKEVTRRREYDNESERDKDRERDRNREDSRRWNNVHSPQRSPTQRTPPHSPSSLHVPAAHDQRRQSGSRTGTPSGSGLLPSDLSLPTSPTQTSYRSHYENTRSPHYEHTSGYASRYSRPDRLSPPPAEGYKPYGPGNRKRSYSPRRRSEHPPPHSPNSSLQERERRRSRSRSQRTRHIPENRPIFFVQAGMNRIGVVRWTFDIDSQTAKNMRLGPRSGIRRIADASSSSVKEKTVLKLACFPAEGFLKCLDVLQSGQNLTANTSPLNPQWPMQGHLIIKVNQDLPNTRGNTYFPDKLSPDDMPISIEQFIYEGQNCIELIQLSGMVDKVFLLFAQTVPVPPPTPQDNTVELPPFETAPGPINLKRAIVKSGRLY